MTMVARCIPCVLLLFLFMRVQAEIFDVRKFGAKPGAEISQAILSAWKQACAATRPSTVVIPRGTYQLNVLELRGPCKAPVEVKLDGTLKGPIDPRKIPDGKQWVTVGYVDHFTLSGAGTLDGQGGAAAWKMNDCHKNKNCPKLGYNLSLNFLTNSTITGITSRDSKNFHVNTNGCNNLTFVKFTISAPGNSPNTDGIHIARVKNVREPGPIIFLSTNPPTHHQRPSLKPFSHMKFSWSCLVSGPSLSTE